MAVHNIQYLYEIRANVSQAVNNLERWLTMVERVNATPLAPVGVGGFGGAQRAQDLDQQISAQNQLNETIENGILRQRHWIDVSRDVDAQGNITTRVLREVTQVYDNVGSIAKETVVHFDRLADGTIATRTEITRHGAEIDRYGRRISNINNRMVRHVQIIAEAIIAYEAFRQVQQVLSDWMRVHREIDWQMALFRISVNDNVAAIREYENALSALSFSTGTPLAEVGETISMTERAKIDPIIARYATEIEMITGVQSKKAVRELYSVQQQFPNRQIEEIMNAFLGGIRAGTLTPSELFGLSETWGAFSRAFRVDMEEIIGLFAGLGTVLGESGGTLEIFMRHLERFYTDPNLAELTYQYTGTPTKYVTDAGTIERTPIYEILREISKLPYNQQEEIGAFLPQELGQKTRQYFSQMVNSWNILEASMETVKGSSMGWSDAIMTMASTHEAATRRLKVAYEELLFSIGNTDIITKFTNSLAAGLKLLADSIPEIGLKKVGSTLYSGIGTPWATPIPWPNKLMPLFEREKTEELFNRLETAFVQTKEYEEVKSLYKTDRYGQNIMAVYMSEFVASEAGQLIAASFLEEINKERIKEGKTPFDMWPAWQELLDRRSAAPAGPGPVVGAAPLGPPSVYYRPAPLDYMQMNRQVVNQDIRNYLDESQLSLQEAYNQFEQEIIDAAKGQDMIIEIQKRTIGITDEFGRAIGKISADSNILSLALRYLTDTINNQISLLNMQQINLPEGMDMEDFNLYYDRVREQLQRIADEARVPIGSRETNVLFLQDGVPLKTDARDPALASLALSQFNREQRQISSGQENAADRRHSEIANYLDQIINALPGLTSPTSVTALQFYQSSIGAYQDQIDEAVRRMRADVNNIIGNRPLEYGLGTELFPDIFTPDKIAAALGADSDTKQAILADLAKEAERQFYGLMRPTIEYDIDRIEAQARQWLEEQTRAKTNREIIRQELGRRIGSEVDEFLQMQEYPPIITYLTGGKTSDVIQKELSSVIDIADVTQQSIMAIDWATTIYSSIQDSTRNNEDTYIAAGQRIGSPLARGAAGAFVSMIVPMIVSEVYNQLNTP